MINPLEVATAGYIIRTTIEVAVDGYLLVGIIPPIFGSTVNAIAKHDPGGSGGPDKKELNDDDLLMFFGSLVQAYELF